MSAPTASTVFVSYNSADRAWAEWIAWQLEDAGYEVTIQAWDFGAGSNFVLKMQDAAAKCERTIGVLSESYLASEFTAPEWAAAFARDPKGEKQKFVPVRVAPCKPEGLLPTIIYIDLLKLDEAAARDKLLADFKPGRKKPSVPPRFPGAPISPSAAAHTAASKPPFPASFTNPWNVPAPAGFFTGREQLLDDLHRDLTRQRRVALNGQGGIGKTQTAIEYAHRHRQAYGAVFFLRADTVSNLIAGMVEIAALLQLPEHAGIDQTQAVQAAARWLRECPGWLLIADNADDLFIAQPYLPPTNAPGCLLLTTQETATRRVALPLEVKVMPPEDGARLLLVRAGLLAADAPLSAASARDQADALALSRELDGLPLALDQAGAYIEETGCSPGGYLRLYRDESKAPRLRAAPRASHPLEHANVTVTFSLAFTKVETLHPAAADLLRLCAFLAPDGIPESLLAVGAPELGELLAVAADEMERNEMIGAARRLSLLRRDAAAKTLSIHREVQAVLRDGMTNEEKLDWTERAVRAMQRAFPDPSQFANWPDCEAILPHALICVNCAIASGMEFLEVASLLNRAAFYLDDQARYAEAEPLYRRALAIWERALGAEHPHTASSLNNLAALYLNQGKLAEAEPLYRRALAIREAAFPYDHPDVADTLEAIASLCQQTERTEEGETLLAQARNIRAAIAQREFGVIPP